MNRSRHCIFRRFRFVPQTVVAVLLLFTSLARAQYGSPVGNGNPGYGGTGTAVPSGDYGHKGQDTIASPSEPDGNSEVSVHIHIRVFRFFLDDGLGVSVEIPDRQIVVT